MIKTKSQIGKASRAAGGRFELKVRADLESKGWIVDKWSNNVEFEEDEKCWCGAEGERKCPDCGAWACGSHLEYKGDCDENHYKACTDCNPERAELKVGKLVKVKNKFLGPGKPMMLGGGFPDFMAFRSHIFIEEATGSHIYFGEDDILSQKDDGYWRGYQIVGVESKMNGYLDKTEKEKCRWLLQNNIFIKILIASKSEKRGKIEYKEFKC